MSEDGLDQMEEGSSGRSEVKKVDFCSFLLTGSIDF